MKAKTTRAFVDAIEGKTARLLFGEDAFDVPSALLPRDAREGIWVRLAVGVVAGPPDRARALREKLGRGDPGGDIVL